MHISEENIHFIDIPELTESFIDSFNFASFDGTTFRMDLCVTRMDETKTPSPHSARKYPVCRLVMSPQTMLEIFNQLQPFVKTLIKENVIKVKTPLKPTDMKKKH